MHKPHPLFQPLLAACLLLLASGAGAASRQAIGTAVVGGMTAATVMSLVFTPVFYVVMQRISELGRRKKDRDQKPLAAKPESAAGSASD